MSELVRVSRTVAQDGSSPLAAVAARDWGYEQVRFVRSSANHVFLCTAAGRDSAVLRFRPDGATEQARRVAELATQLASAGAPVAPAVQSSRGEWVTRFENGGGSYVASLFRAVSGKLVDSEAITPHRARSWGRGLALLHETGTRLADAPELPSWLEALSEAAVLMPEPELRNAAGSLVREVARLPTSAAVFGVVHGDPELDNVIWADDETPVFVDLDDASLSWFAGDICFALRDFAPDLGSEPVTSFLAGYRELRTLTDAELEALPLFARGHALITLARLERPRAESADASWPEWARRLRLKLDAVAQDLRAQLIAS